MSNTKHLVLAFEIHVSLVLVIGFECSRRSKHLAAQCERKINQFVDGTMNFMKAIVAAIIMAVPLAISSAHAGGARKVIVDTAASTGQFNTLVAAVKAAGLVEALKGKGPFTVFAPTDAAFKKLPKGTPESLLKPANKSKLAAILTYHVVPGKVMAGDIASKELKATSVQGQKISINATDGVKVDEAKVVKADIVTSNGAIHIIEPVILPKS